MSVPNVSPWERVEEAVKSTLEGNLEAELTLIEAEAGDGLSIPRPNVYLNAFGAEETDQVLIEIVAVAALLDATQAPMEFTFGRFSSDVIVEVAAVVRKNMNWDDTTYHRVMNRYLAAFLRVLVYRYQELGDNTGKILSTIPHGNSRMEMDVERDPGGRMVRRGVLPLMVRVQELM